VENLDTRETVAAETASSTGRAIQWSQQWSQLVVASAEIFCSVGGMGTVLEIEAAIEKLAPAAQRELAAWLNARVVEDTPEMLAALDVGIRSLETEPTVPLEDVRRKIKAWATG